MEEPLGNVKTGDGTCSLEQNGLSPMDHATKPATNDAVDKPQAPRSVDINMLPSIEELEEDAIDVERKAAHSQWDIVGDQVFENAKRQGHFKTRARQSVLHNTFTTMRIEELEKELQSLKAIVYGLGEDWKAPVKLKLPVHRHELLRSSMNRFRVTRQSVLMPTTEQPALEVQISDTIAPRNSTLEAEAGPLNDNGPPNSLAEPHAQSGRRPRGDSQRTPERLRIRSQPLLSHLEKLTGRSTLSLAQPNRVDEQKVYSGVTFLRPFKFFVKNDAAIRESLKDLEAEMETKALQETASNSNQNGNLARSQRVNEREFDDKDLLEDLKYLVKFLDEDLRSTFELRQKIRDGTAEEIEYGDLWHLFERGAIVVTRSDQNHAYRVINLAGGREPLSFNPKTEPSEKDDKPVRLDGFVVDCISIGTNGSSYIPKLEKITIKRFHGSRAITNLAVYPLRFDPNEQALRAKFVEGGKGFLEVTRNPFCHKLVMGKTLDEPSHEIDGQVIVDMSLATAVKPEWRLKPNISTDELTQRDKRETVEDSWCRHRYEACCGSDAIFKDLDYDDMDAEMFNRNMAGMLGPLREKDLTDEDLMLMQTYVHAFVLRSRQWVTVWVADLHDVVFENRFDDLVLPEDHRTTVRALVKTHENTRASHSSATVSPSIGSALDLVKGKGAGLIILLHGPPGVGKTSTAECVADDTRRPLYPITCGDIGETAAEVESNLQYNFRLAHKWGCVLLLDEADVFLAKRTKSDLRHNAVTSVFLRSLEYYAGILFLTTNRVGAIDSAFKSRIQMSLFYPRLTLDVTYKLYEKFIKRAKEEQEQSNSFLFKIKDKEILRFAKKHFRELEKECRDTWNGRQIRNAFQTAIALTEHQSMSRGADEPKPILGKEQFETVARGFRKFDDYLVNILGTEADVAKREGMRDDGFTASMATPMVPLTALHRPAYPLQPTQIGRQAMQNLESDDDSESESDSEDSDDDQKGKKSHSGMGTTADSVEAAHPTVAAGLPFDMQQVQQFLQFQKMMSQQSK